MRAGLAMFFVTLADPELMQLAERYRRRTRDRALLQHPLVGDPVIEINPRISTVVYQEDLIPTWG